MKTLYVTDLDGTLLVENKEIGVAEFSKETISKLKDLLSDVIDRTGFITSYIDGKMTKIFSRGNLTDGLNRYLEEHANDTNLILVGKDEELFK